VLADVTPPTRVIPQGVRDNPSNTTPGIRVLRVNPLRSPCSYCVSATGRFALLMNMSGVVTKSERAGVNPLSKSKPLFHHQTVIMSLVL